MPLGLHLPELLAILAVALLIFGPKKLPEMGASIGKSIQSFKKGMKEINEPEEPAAPVTKLETIEREIASKRHAAATKTTIVEAPVE